MRAASCFSGIGGAELALPEARWLWSAEIEPFPNAVREAHFPEVPNLGDVLADDFLQRASAFGPLDLLVGGPPCQDFSVAGLRQGLDGDRGNLTLRWVQIIHAIRPRYAVTENVPGWLSVNGGHAFGAFLAGLVGHDTALLPPKEAGGRWTDAGMVAGPVGRAAWRTLDAQFFGLAQRRRRVFVVFCPRGGDDPAAVLLERKGVRGNSATRGCEGQRAAAIDAGNFSCNQAVDAGHIVADPICANEQRTYTHEGKNNFRLRNVVAEAFKASHFTRGKDGSPSDVVPPLSADIELATAVRGHEGSGYHIDFETETFIAYDVTGTPATNGAHATDVHTPLRANRPPGTSEASTTTLITAFRENTRGEVKDVEGDVFQSLTSGGGKPGYPAVLLENAPETVYSVRHGDAQETRSHQALRALRDAVDQETLVGWCAGSIAAFWPQEVLRSGLYGSSIRCPPLPKRGLVNVSLSCAQAGRAWTVQDLWEAGCDGCPPQGWRPSEQLARQLGAYLSRLPYSPSPASRFLQDMWEASEGLGLLREALSTLQEIRRSASIQAQSAHTAVVRRLIVEECEALQGVARGYTAITYRGKPAADGARYRALGNGFAINVVRWLLLRITAQL